MAEGQVLRNAVGVGRMDHPGPAEGAATLPALGLVQMPAARVGEEHFAARGDLEPFGDGFSGLIPSGATHNLFWFL
jgi:hypothetical protein